MGAPHAEALAGPVGGRTLLEEAAAGVLPEWAVASPARLEHCARVAELMGSWAEAMGVPQHEKLRWQAAGWLHDALRDAEPAMLREMLPPDARDLPGPLLHGPAAAARLRTDGVDDPELLDAIAYHTVGYSRFGLLGQTLYLADYLEPGRTFDPERTAALRARVPAEFDAVLLEVVAERLGHQLALRRPLRPETVEFWNSLVTRELSCRPA